MSGIGRMSVQDGGLRDALTNGTALRDYVIESLLGYGGFGIVYRARHRELGSTVALKEYLPVELSVREGDSVHPRSGDCAMHYEDGMRRFLEEARQLTQFRSHPGVVTCLDFFRANGTAYLVMEHEDGLPLSELLRQREAAGRPFEEEDLLAIAVPLLQGLSRVHAAGCYTETSNRRTSSSGARTVSRSLSTLGRQNRTRLYIASRWHRSQKAMRRLSRSAMESWGHGRTYMRSGRCCGGSWRVAIRLGSLQTLPRWRVG